MKKALILPTLLLALSSTSQAANRALIIGLAEYADPNLNLVGPNEDVDMAISIARKLGFKDNEIKVLKNKDATRQNVLAGLNTWASQGVTPQDKVFVYYSGHGSQVPDRNNEEDDGCDESIVPYDLSYVIDDEIGSALSKIQAREVMMLFDSCFSGTITKAFGRQGDGLGGKTNKYIKSSTPCNVPSNVKSKQTRDFQVVARDDNGKTNTKYIEFTAASNNEVAFAQLDNSMAGSLFTHLLYQELQKNPRVSFDDLHNLVTQKIRAISTKNDLLAHTPNLLMPASWRTKSFLNFGNLERAQNVSNPADINSAQTYLDIFESLRKNSSFAVDIYPNQLTFRPGEELVMEFSSQQNGYLNILELNPKGQLSLLFPNQKATKNQIRAGQTLKIPNNTGNFALRATEPYGDSHILAVVTIAPLNLYTDNTGTKNQTGLMKIFEAGQVNPFKRILLNQKNTKFEVVDPRANNTQPSDAFGANYFKVKIVQ